MMAILTLAGLYVSLALVLALALVKFIPAHRLPAIHIPQGVEQSAAGGVLLFAIFTLLLTSSEISTSFDLPFMQAFLQMLYGSLQGKGVMGLLVCGAVWYGSDAFMQSRIRPILQFAAASGNLMFAAVTMHAASLDLAAYAAQTIHLFAIAFWLGFLFLVAWFAKEGSSWRPFLAWFFPAAALSVLMVMVSGLMLMNDLSSDWVDAWVLDYGQALLVKHLLFVPLLVFAGINGILSRRRFAALPAYDPRSWYRAESVVALAVFTAAAFLSRQAPPHDLRQTLRDTPPSDVFDRLYDGAITPDIHLAFTLQPLTVILLLTSVAFLGMTLLVYIRGLHASIGVATSLLFTISGYLTLMMAIQ